MRLSSFEFILFLGLVAGLYHALRGRGSRWLLLGASAAFYAAFLEPLWLLALGAVIVVTWAAGLGMQKAKQSQAAERWMWAGIVFALGLLCALKYLGLGAEAVNAVLALASRPERLPVLQPLLFLGLSYYVFQAISYLADIHFGNAEAEPSLAWMALYLGFFPKLVQGPIERIGTLLPQLKAPYAYDEARLRRGVLLFSWGLFKKAVVAERLAPLVDGVFQGLAGQPAPSLLATAWLFALQLYCDFSGYTDMALGAAELFNLRLTDNFDEPYLARSMRDFWRRWHISLSTWILDYVFQPLQMLFRYGGNAGLAAAIFIAFFLMGVWHGATAAYVVFGLVQGLFMAASILYRPWQKKLHAKLGIGKAPWLPLWQVLFTLNLVVLSFVLFRAGTLAQAGLFYRGLAHGWSQWGMSSLARGLEAPAQAATLALSLGVLAAGELGRRRVRFGAWPAWSRWSIYTALLALLLLLGQFYAQKQFIYAQF